jgi:hypothetical protein
LNGLNQDILTTWLLRSREIATVCSLEGLNEH